MGNTVAGDDVVLRRGVEPGVPEPGTSGPLRWIVFLISAGTCLSGAVQVFFPDFVLRLVGGDQAPTARHFFGIIGMFMFLFGGMMLHALRSPSTQRVAILWAALQKFGASVAVAFGVTRHLFSMLALGIAGFDFLSGILIFWYWKKVRSNH